MLRDRDRFRNSVIWLCKVFNAVFAERTAFRIQHTAFFFDKILNTFQNGNIPRRSTVVIANERYTAVCIGPDDADSTAFIRVQRKQTVVFQQHTGFQGGFVSKADMLRALDSRIGNTIIFVVSFSECAEHKTRGEKPDGTAGDILFGNHPKRIGVHDVLISTATVEVAACLQSLGDRLRFICCDMMIFVEVPDGPAVRDKIPSEAPFVAELVHQKFACTADLTVCAVIGAHNGLNACIYKFSESREIGFLQIFC